MVKALVEDGRYRYIFSGSLLDVALTHIGSQPVGYLDSITMYPLDFEEFVLNQEISPDSIASIEQSFASVSPVSEHLHSLMMGFSIVTS